MRRGQVLYTGDLALGTVAIAWHWAECRPGVLCIEDLAAVLSNASLVDEDDSPLSWTRRVACLNTLIYLIPWQQQICGRMRDSQQFAMAA